MTLKELVEKHRAAADAPPPAPAASTEDLKKDIEARDQALTELEAARLAAVQERDFSRAEVETLKTELEALKQKHALDLAAAEATAAEKAESLARDMIAAQGVPPEGLPAASAGQDTTDQAIASLRAELAAIDPKDGEKRGALVTRIKQLQAQKARKN